MGDRQRGFGATPTQKRQHSMNYDIILVITPVSITLKEADSGTLLFYHYFINHH